MTEPAPPEEQLEDSLTYRFRPRLIGADFTFRLEGDALAWDTGRLRGRTAYRDFVRMRLGYRPTNLSGSRFVTELWARDGTKLAIASISQRALFDYQNLAAEYRAFVPRLGGKIAAAGGDCRCEAGFPPWRWWPALAVAVATMIAAIYLLIQALLLGQDQLAVMVAAIGILFLWQIGKLVLRNRPRRFDPSMIPRAVLP